MNTKHMHSNCCAPTTPHKHDHSQHGDSHDHDHGHDHGVLPSWPRISAALVMALLAEIAHWFIPQYAALEYAGMVLAVVAIGLAGLGVYKAGIQSLLQLRLGIHALVSGQKRPW
jgi:Cd2+/Zn2+-exporting ATPase